jgi:predicted lipid carrier protein YhbT
MTEGKGMAVTTKIIEENGKQYRVTEDPETGLYIKECLDEGIPPMPKPDPLSDPITQLQLAVAELAEAIEADKTAIHLALAEVAEIIAGGDS